MTHTVNGHTPRRFTPAADQPVVSLDKPPAGARLVDPVELVDVDEIEGEVLAAPVDQPDTDPGIGWIAERRGRMQDAPGVLPSWLRDRDQFADSAAFVARWYGREAAFHAMRAPVYTLRLWSGAPRGAYKAGRKWVRWVTDAEARPVEAKAALSDPDTWSRFVVTQSRRTGPRRRLSIVVAVPVALLVTLAAVLLPTWVLTAAGAAALTVLGWVGKDPDRPIVGRYVAVHLQRRLDSGEVETALEAIGIKGTVDFTAPIAVDGPGWAAELDLPRGVLADAILEKRPELAAAMRRPLGCVWPETDPDAHPGRLRLWVAREDPAKAPRRLWPLLKAGQTDLFEPIPFGWDPRGRLVTLSLTGANVLIGGVMGSGKTSAVLVLALAGALDPTCELWLYEMKGSGDLDPLRPVCHRYRSGDDDEDCEAALGALHSLESEMNRRKKVVKGLPISDVPEGRKVSRRLADRRELGLHPLLAIFDEAHTLFEHPEYGEEAAAVAGRLIRKARAYGIVIVFTTQRPDAKSIPKTISDNAILRFCLAVTGHLANNLVLGSGMYAKGVRATMFDPRKDAGTGWLARSATDTQIARAAFITQQEAVEVGRRALAVRTAAGLLTGEAAGRTVQDADPSTLLDHLRDIWPAGEDSAHSWRLVQALAAYRPELYGEWIPAGLDGLDDDAQKEARTAASTTLANALKPYGVTTRQINKRGAGGGAKGVRWDDLAAVDKD
ncbi:FtsK/SpoIIIE domain-containing protein [Actinomadura nitritigenes]|uniref:FtsK/SpoIIIE domain-containing protein n=1 Tax=Actinomadura nitritigenes TaxID=134602 RepID=UPI003D8EBD69